MAFNSKVKLPEIPAHIYDEVTPLTMEIIWENASPTSNFSPQQISLTLSKYIYFIVFYKVSANASTGICSAPVIRSLGMHTTQYISGENNCMKRNFKGTDSYIEWEAGKTGGSTDNSSMVPQRVYGVRRAGS